MIVRHLGGGKKYQVVFVDEYNNWWLVGFCDSLEEAKPQVNEFLEAYVDEKGETIQLGKGETPDLVEYPGTCGPCFDVTINVPEGCVQVRGFVFE